MAPWCKASAPLTSALNEGNGSASLYGRLYF